ncbi:glycosyltransferase [Parendozoicomonas haliclonae]|uniref:Glycosyl transferase family 28 C-terminal domain-containing protein n=1 Tax=Parendozoicomonas haliclonae TaxID=1960125 RepID=A0A1X7AMU2_9GAMM|nr:nucleotide disphospho-sugar-binding domain-containing protein [Parendozoicomonas haliclonae]SMA49603.1 hypothetical protein EHSB41UT_03388 [Parendozoicomonas haliclonae]
MAHIVLAWELGGGFGHLNRLLSLAQELLDAGYRVSLVARDAELARVHFRHLPIAIYQAPHIQEELPGSLAQTPAYVHVLFNVGYGDPEILGCLVRDWFYLLAELSPDLLIADHAPTALMVSRDWDIPRINYGDGFTCPAPTSPLPVLHGDISLNDVLQSEWQILGWCNQTLEQLGLSPLEWLGQIYDVDEVFLMTWPELDHLGHREQVCYHGVQPPPPRFNSQSYNAPPLQSCGMPHFFAYLKQTPWLESQLQVLSSLGVYGEVYVKDMAHSLREQYICRHEIRLLTEPADMHAVLLGTDLVISHGGHELTALCLQAGVPQLHVPLNLEQQLIARRCQQTGTSLSVEPHQFEEQLHSMLHNLRYYSDQAEQVVEKLTVSPFPLRRCLVLIDHWLQVKQAVNAD